MKKFEYTITDPTGIHARPAGLLAELANNMDSTVTIARTVPTKKLLSVMILGLKQGDTISVIVEGGSEASNTADLEQFLEENL